MISKKLIIGLILVEAFIDNSDILKNVRTDLKNVSDIQRILGRLNKAKASLRDLYALAEP